MNSSFTELLTTSTAVDFDPFAAGEILSMALATEAQREIWASVQMGDEANCAYNESISIALRGELAPALLELAFQQLVQRHEALRTTFSPDGVHLCIAEASRLEIKTLDLSGFSEANQAQKIANFKKQAVSEPFNLEQGPLLRVVLLQLQAQEHLLLLTAHHIIFDGWSWGIVIPELGQLYSALRQGLEPDLEEAERFSDYALMLEAEADSEETTSAEAYWLAQFAQSLPVMDLPSDHPRPAARTFEAGRIDWDLDPTLVTALKQLGKSQGCSFLTIMLAGFEVFLHRLLGESELVVGVPTAGQIASGHYQLVGHCVNLLPLRSYIDSAQTFTAYLQSRRCSLLNDFEHQQFTFGSLIKKLSIPRDPSRIPLVSVAFNMEQGLESEQLDFAGLKVKVCSNPRCYENFELFINGTEQAGKLTLECQYNRNLFEADTISRRMAEFETLLSGIVACPDQTIARLPLLPEREQRLLTQWNSTQALFDQKVLIHQQVEQQAERTPHALALQSDGQAVTYDALNRQANQIAHRLRSLGVKPDVLVGICLERSPEFMIAALAVLKAGGAYVPLDPEYPSERLAFMIEDANLKVMLTQRQIQAQLPVQNTASDLQIIDLDRDESELGAESDANLSNLASSDHLAYVIYTSGSTGKPKGVEICHLGLLNLINWHQQTYCVTPADRATQIASPAFDASVWEIWPYLAAGASIHIPDAETRVTPAKLLTYLAAKAISLCFLPTPLAEMLLDQPLPAHLVLRAMLIGGDRLRQCPTRSLPFQLVNHYGPTENTVVTTSAMIPARELQGVPPIGHPIYNNQLHVLDANQQPTPIGIPGELHIQSIGLARGYLNCPELTAEKFISLESGARVYKTGDLVRYRSDGNLEFLGRIDYQVKLRGLRIELGEIEATLLQHPVVKEAAVLLNQSDQTLVGYVSLHSEAGTDSLNAQQVSDWQSRWEILYAAGRQAALQNSETARIDDRAILRQFTEQTEQNAYELDAQEWLSQTLSRIRRLNPQRIYEIGCGTGQLLLEICPDCSYYLGTDYSNLAIQHLKSQIQSRPELQDRVTVECRAADNFQQIAPDSFDTVVIHSVTQYFPDGDYLLHVLEQSVRATAPDGWIYVGDVQSYGLLAAHHTGEQLCRSPESMPVAALQAAIRNRLRNEDELMIDPSFFEALPQHLPQIQQVEIWLRRGSKWNEATQFHYDVCLRVGAEAVPELTPTWHDWLDEGLTVAAVQSLLASSQPDYLCLQHIPNARTQRQIQAQKLLSTADLSSLATVADLRRALATLPRGIDPEDLWALGEILPYQVDLCCSDSMTSGYFEAIFRKQALPPCRIAKPRASELRWLSAKLASVNHPALKRASNSGQLSELRQYIKQHLPVYMLPAELVVLEAMPLTANGKIDRKALPVLERGLTQADRYVAPRSPIEQQIAEIWAQVMRLERVGLHDNFFELGGHSLLGTQVVSRISQLLQIKLPLRTLFEVPTVAEFAQHVETLQWAIQSAASPTAGEFEEGEL